MNACLCRRIFLVLLASSLAAGCATTRAQQPGPSDLENRIASLQNELHAKDQEIQDLQLQLQSLQQPLEPSGTFVSKREADIRVPGVTAKDVQRALVRAGLDPGPVDGRFGKKTKRAIKDFQKKHNLKADGVVGEKTWALLKAF
ncbi:MAG: peptidoglycan-binding protein [Candidatus Omnitrophica bacterium]|nr:peptidoglycan-binding protein [Candidatus Omnitrophota bacterium]